MVRRVRNRGMCGEDQGAKTKRNSVKVRERHRERERWGKIRRWLHKSGLQLAWA